MSWKIKLYLDGIDLSENLINNLRIEGEEGTAKIAEFSLIPFSGPISVTKWIGKTIQIYYQSTGIDMLLFRGLVDEPSYDPVTKITNFTCTDQLQGLIEKLNFAEIDQCINGYWSNQIFEKNDKWTYAQDQLSTIPVSLDLDKTGAFQLTLWEAKNIPDYTFSEDDLLYQSIEIKLANRRELHNHVHITFQYRYQRLKQREIQFDYRYPLVFCEQLFRNSTLPNVDMIQQAIDGTGWLLKGKVEYEHQHPSGWVKCGDVTSAFMIREELRKYLVRDARFILAKRFGQTVTENYQLSIAAPQSVSEFGEISQQSHFSVENPAETDKFTQVDKYQPPMKGSILDAAGDYTFEAGNEDQLQQAVVTKLNQAKTEILKSHRNNLITFKAPLLPMVERHHTLKLDTTHVKAQGKVKHIVHECDFNTGSALSTITLAVSRTDNVMVVDESKLHAPKSPSALGRGREIKRIELPTHLGGKQSSPEYDESWDGYTGNEKLEPNGKAYPERFVVSIPAIDEAQAPVNINVSYQYQIHIPNELLELSA